MPHFQNQHEDRTPKGVYLTEDQFSKLVELLTPGHDLAKLYLAQAQAQAEAAKAPADLPTVPSDEGSVGQHDE